MYESFKLIKLISFWKLYIQSASYNDYEFLKNNFHVTHATMILSIYCKKKKGKQSFFLFSSFFYKKNVQWKDNHKITDAIENFQIYVISGNDNVQW